jgi:hypothetical protein
VAAFEFIFESGVSKAATAAAAAAGASNGNAAMTIEECVIHSILRRN